MDQMGSESAYVMGLAFADEDESPSPRRSFGKESPNLQEVPARAWGREVHTGRLSHVVIAVDARPNIKWRRRKPQKGVKGLVRRLGTSSSKAWKKCFRPCMDFERERGIDLGNMSSDEMLKESVPVLFTDESPGLQEQAMRALLHLSGVYGNPLKIVSFPRAVEGIVRLLLRDDEPNLQRLATLTLGNLALRQVSAVASVAMEGLAGLLFQKDGRLLELNIQLQEEAASVLANICYSPEGGKKVMNPWTDALEGLMKLLFKHDRKGAQEEATRALVNLALVQENAEKLLKFPTVSVIGGLVGLLTDFERSAVVENVIRALASLSYAPQNAKKIAESEHFSRALQGLVGILMRRRRKDGSLQELAVMTLANLSVTSEIQIQIADFPHALPELLWCLTSSNNQGVVEHAAMALGNLSFAQENRPKIANHVGMLRALVDTMADNTNLGGQEHAAYALSNLTHAHETNQLKIADVPGVMKGLVHLLMLESSPSSQEQAARLMANLTYPEENSLKIITYPGALSGLSALLAKHENINLQREVTRAFANLTCSRDNRWISSFCTSGLASLLITFSVRRYAATSSVEIEEICDTTLTISMPESKRSMLPALALEYRAIEESGNSFPEIDPEEMLEIKMLDVAIENVKIEQSSGALENQGVGKREEAKMVVVVVDNLPRSSQQQQHLALEAMILEHDIPEETPKILLLHEEDHRHNNEEPEVEVKTLGVTSEEKAETSSDHHVLTDSTEDDRTVQIDNIAQKLRRLAMHPDRPSTETLPEVDVVEETTAKEKMSTRKIESDLEMDHLTEVDEINLKLGQARPVLLEIEVTDEENELRIKEVENLILEQVSIALGNLAIHKENKRIIGECEDALTGLVGLLPRYDCPGVQENAAWALANLFHEEDGTDVVDTIAKLKGSRAIEPLGELLLDNDIPLVQEQAARALANLAYFPENQAEIIKLPQALTGVVDLMSRDEHPEIQEKAVRLLTNLTCAKLYMTTIADYPGVVPGLSNLLAKEKNPDIQKTAAMCLTNLALAPENIPTLVESRSAMASVVELLSNDENPAAQEQAAKFIVNVAAVQDGTHQLRISEFPRILPELEKFLFQDENSGVQEQAIKALVNLARTPENQEKVLEDPEALAGIARTLTKDDNSVVQLNGALAFRNLSLEISNLRKIVDCPNVLAGLVRLVSRLGDPVQEVAVLTLLNLSRLRDIAIALAKFDYPRVSKDLATLLRMSDNKLVVESTAMILTNLATAPENRPLIADVPEVAKALEWLLSDCALEEQLLATSMFHSQRLLTSDVDCDSNLNEDARGSVPTIIGSTQTPKGQRTSTSFWAATALTLIDFPRSRAITLHSGDAYKGRANAMIWMGMLNEAINELSFSIDLQPEAPGTFSLRGIAKSLLKDYEGAIVDANRGIELDPQYSGWYQERGILKRILGDLEGALVDLNKAVELEKDDYEMLKHRGYVRYLLLDEEGAREDAESALRVKDASTTLHESLYDDHIVSFLGALPVEYMEYKLR